MSRLKEDLKEIRGSPPLFDPLGGVVTPDPAPNDKNEPEGDKEKDRKVIGGRCGGSEGVEGGGCVEEGRCVEG